MHSWLSWAFLVKAIYGFTQTPLVSVDTTTLTLGEHCKSIYPQAPGRQPSGMTPIYYLHVPKSGSSMANIIAEASCDAQQNAMILEPSAFRHHASHFFQGDQIKCSFARFDSGHEPLLTQDLIPQAGHIVTSLRKPIARIVSGFLHNAHDCAKMQRDNGLRENRGLWLADKKSITEDMKEDLLEYAMCVDGCATKLISGVHCGDATPPATENQVAYAISALDSFGFVGISDFWEQSMCLWDAMFVGTYQAKFTLASERQAHNPELEKKLRQVLFDADWKDTDEHVYRAALSLFKTKCDIFLK